MTAAAKPVPAKPEAAKPAPVKASDATIAAPVAFAKQQPAAADPAPAAPAPAMPDAPAEAAAPAEPAAAQTSAAPAKIAPPKIAPAKVAPAKVASAKPAAARKPAKTKARKAKAAAPVRLPAAARPAKAGRIAAPAAKPKAAPAIPVKSAIKTNPKEPTMTKTSKISETLKSFASEAQEKAKTVYTKGTALVGGAGEFTKGNVAAVVESGKILATGLQEMGTDIVEDTKAAFDTFQSDVKEFASIKSPTDLIELQNSMMRRNIDKAVAYNSKASESFLRLANDMMAPLSGRVSLAMQKVRSAA